MKLINKNKEKLQEDSQEEQNTIPPTEKVEKTKT